MTSSTDWCLNRDIFLVFRAIGEIPFVTFGSIDVAMFRFVVDFNMWMIRAEVTFAAGLWRASNLDRETVLGMARITLANRTIWPLVGNIVTGFTSLLGANDRLEDCAISRGIEAELISVL